MAKTTNAAAKSTGLGIGKFVAVLVIIGLIAAGVLFYFTNSPAPPLQSFANTNAQVPAVFTSALSNSNPTQSVSAISSITAHQLNSTPEFHANYSGTVYVKANGAGSALGTISSPLYMWIAQYAQVKHLSATVTSASAAGLVNVQYIYNQNPYLCTNFNYQAVQQGSITALISKSPECGSGSSIAGINLGQLYSFNLQSLNSVGLTFSYGSSYQSAYQGTNCTVVIGTVSGDGGNGHFIECMSDKYYVPLSFGMNFSGSPGAFTVILNETSIGNSSSQSAVTYIPYSTS